ncbi:MAG: hypothetical protein ACLQBQ_08310 [Smithella sp.]
MALKTTEQYDESRRNMNLKVYQPGELVKNSVDNPIIRPSIKMLEMIALSNGYFRGNRRP